MVNSYINIVTFILTTIFYYLFLKPKLSYDILVDFKKYEEYSKKNYLYLGVYLVLVIGIQIMVNASIISEKCISNGGNVLKNISAAGMLTIIPGILVFGVMIIVLIFYPGFKSAFSDVIGFFYISRTATKIINELLINKEIEENDSSSISEEERKTITYVISKIFGNASLLLNQIYPENFFNYWKILTPLMKPQYKDNSLQETQIIRNQLFELIVTKDNIGESLWYIYTGILLTSIVQLKIATIGCNKNKTMEKNIDFFKESKAKAEAKKRKKIQEKKKSEEKKKNKQDSTI